MQRDILEIKQEDWNNQRNCLKGISIHIMITCLKTFLEILCYNKLYNKMIYLDLNKKSLEAATKRCFENGYCMNYEKKSRKIPVKSFISISQLYLKGFDHEPTWKTLQNSFFSKMPFFQNTSQWMILKLWNTYSKEIKSYKSNLF